MTVRRRTVILQPGDALDHLPADWSDALVVVRTGELELECASGRRVSFAAGAILTFAILPVRRLRNRCAEPLVLLAITRCCDD